VVESKEWANLQIEKGDGVSSETATRINLERAAKKIHPWQDSKKARLRALERVKNKTHPWLGDKNPSCRKSKDKIHPWQDSEWQRRNQLNLVENRTHNFLGGEIGGKASRERVANKTHHFIIKYMCFCGKTGKGPRFKNNHFDNCKEG
jgi:hypothetical protein